MADFLLTLSWKIRAFSVESSSFGMRTASPRFLYHGSPEHLGILYPRQAHDVDDPAGCLNGVYATDIMDAALIFSLGGMPDAEGRLSRFMHMSRSKKMVFVHGRPNLGGTGWLYKLSPKGFTEVSSHQWVSPDPVRPLEAARIQVDGHRHLWRYATPEEMLEYEHQAAP